MLAKIRALFSLEKRLGDGLQGHLQAISISQKDQIAALQEQVRSATKLIEQLKGDFNYRLSKFEVLFADELAAKEAERDEFVKQKRLGKKPDGH